MQDQRQEKEEQCKDRQVTWSFSLEASDEAPEQKRTQGGILDLSYWRKFGRGHRTLFLREESGVLRVPPNVAIVGEMVVSARHKMSR